MGWEISLVVRCVPLSIAPTTLVHPTCYLESMKRYAAHHHSNDPLTAWQVASITSTEWDSHRDEVAAHQRMGGDGNAQQPFAFAEAMIGERVRVMGLQGKPQLNGRTGVALHLDRASGRMAVDLGEKDGKVKVRVQNVEGLWLPMRVALAVVEDDIPTVRKWLQAGGDVNAWGGSNIMEGGMTMLHMASGQLRDGRSSELVQFLVESLADVTLRDSSGRKAADYTQQSIAVLGSRSDEDGLRKLAMKQTAGKGPQICQSPSLKEEQAADSMDSDWAWEVGHDAVIQGSDEPAANGLKVTLKHWCPSGCGAEGCKYEHLAHWKVELQQPDRSRSRSSCERPSLLCIPPRQLAPIDESSTCYSDPSWKLVLNDGQILEPGRSYMPNDIVFVEGVSSQFAGDAMSSGDMFRCNDGISRPVLLYCVVCKPQGLPSSAPDDMWMLKSLNHRSQVCTYMASESQMKLLHACPTEPVHDACMEWGIGSSSDCFVDKTNGSRPAFALTLGPGENMRHFERARQYYVGDLAVRNTLDGTIGLPPSPSGFYLPCIPRNYMLGALPSCRCKDMHCCLVLLALLSEHNAAAWGMPPQAPEIFPGAHGDPATTAHNLQWVCIEHIDMTFEGARQMLAKQEAKGRTAVSSVLRICVVCKAGGKNACSKCKKVWYCSKECQRKHWKASHKAECVACT